MGERDSTRPGSLPKIELKPWVKGEGLLKNMPKRHMRPKPTILPETPVKAFHGSIRSRLSPKTSFPPLSPSLYSHIQRLIQGSNIRRQPPPPESPPRPEPIRCLSLTPCSISNYLRRKRSVKRRHFRVLPIALESEGQNILKIKRAEPQFCQGEEKRCRTLMISKSQSVSPGKERVSLGLQGLQRDRRRSDVSTSVERWKGGSRLAGWEGEVD